MPLRFAVFVHQHVKLKNCSLHFNNIHDESFTETQGQIALLGSLCAGSLLNAMLC